MNVGFAVGNGDDAHTSKLGAEQFVQVSPGPGSSLPVRNHSADLLDPDQLVEEQRDGLVQSAVGAISTQLPAGSSGDFESQSAGFNRGTGPAVQDAGLRIQGALQAVVRIGCRLDGKQQRSAGRIHDFPKPFAGNLVALLYATGGQKSEPLPNRAVLRLPRKRQRLSRHTHSFRDLPLEYDSIV